jgi:hypothetical protein
MVQRNMTPGGDKNGADITMALDALEMAFTHDHINAFVIVGGDSDFISLVEKLKQYGRKVIVVGGRQFTSVTMQRNCHEFIAYENLVRSGGRSADRGGRPVVTSDMSKALPLVKRALKVLSEREVSPQLGLLKSTLLQLDSTFSEREYGASSFRDFMEKIAQTGAVTLKHAGRSMMVESREDGPADIEVADGGERPVPTETRPPRPAGVNGDDEDESVPASPMAMQDGIRAVQQAVSQATPPPRWPMYVRQAKQFLRNAIDGFDERKYGFVSVVDLLRAAGKEGVLRIERDRQGAIRVFPGPNVATPLPTVGEAPVQLDETIDVEVPAEAIVTAPEVVNVIEEAPPIEEAQIIDDPEDVQPPNLSNESAPIPGTRAPRRGARGRKTAGTRTSPRESAARAQKETRVPKARKRRAPPPETD